MVSDFCFLAAGCNVGFWDVLARSDSRGDAGEPVHLEVSYGALKLREFPCPGNPPRTSPKNPSIPSRQH